MEWGGDGTSPHRLLPTCGEGDRAAVEGLSKPHGRRAFFSNVVTFAHHLVILGLVPRIHNPGVRRRPPSFETERMDPRDKPEDDEHEGGEGLSLHRRGGRGGGRGGRRR